ncbi:hypothetical protein GWK47_047814 [Chionoecetes opilio]|uniref:Uncharacterized protein n=1 Tax=Chionoecetes opilio TaxID=41210 RepID=A0A8J5CG33_CHIOP|nr:hypothetical protein GWK47_047814 [Chionoecetes opilio]
MKERLNAVLRVLEGLANDCNADRAIDARGLLGQINAGFAMKLAIMTHIIGRINQLSNLLQSANLDMVKAVELIETVKAHLEEMRSDPASFDALWDEVERNSAAHGFDTSECRMCRSPRKRNCLHNCRILLLLILLANSEGAHTLISVLRIQHGLTSSILF